MAIGSQLTQQLQQDVQNELATSSQLLQLMSQELQKIKQLIGPGGELEAGIKQNKALMSTLTKTQNIEVPNLPPIDFMALTEEYAALTSGLKDIKKTLLLMKGKDLTDEVNKNNHEN